MTRCEAHLQKALESIRDLPSDDPWWFCFAVETARNALDHQPSNRRQPEADAEFVPYARARAATCCMDQVLHPPAVKGGELILPGHRTHEQVVEQLEAHLIKAIFW